MCTNLKTLAVNIPSTYLLSDDSPENGVTFRLFELAAKYLLGRLWETRPIYARMPV